MIIFLKYFVNAKTAPVSASSTKCLLLFVQRNSRKRGPWNYSLTCRPVLTRLLVPKTTRENGEKFSALNTPTAPQTQNVSTEVSQKLLPEMRSAISSMEKKMDDDDDDDDEAV